MSPPDYGILFILAGLTTTISIITYGASYWYWTRRPLGNVVLFSLAMLGVSVAASIIGGFFGSSIGSIVVLAGGLYSIYYLLNKTQVFGARNHWIKILLTAVIANIVLGMLILHIAFSLDVGTASQALLPIGGA